MYGFEWPTEHFTRPEARDLIVNLPGIFTNVYEEISKISGHLYMAWPFHPQDLIDVDLDTGLVYASSLVENYAQDLNNWSLHANVTSLYPVLTGCFPVTY